MPQQDKTQENAPIYIYGLVDPRDGQIRYIGQTVNYPRLKPVGFHFRKERS